MGLSANIVVPIRADNAGPTVGSSAITTANNLNGWTNTTSTTITASGTMNDTLSGMREYVVQYDWAPLTGTVCGSYTGTWTDLGAPSATIPASTNHTGLTTGRCYQHRVLGTDNVGNSTPRTSATVLKVDMMPAPSGAIDPLPAFIGGTRVISGTALDSLSGFATFGTVTLHYRNLTTLATGPLVTRTGTGANPAAPNWTYSWNTALAGPAYPDGSYELWTVITDVAGNSTISATTNVEVENNPPTISFVSFTEGANPGNMMQNGATNEIWVRSGAGISGDFTVEFTAGGVFSGITNLQFPVGTTGLLPSALPAADTAAPYEQNYSWSGAVTNGTRTVTATSGAGRTNTATFIVTNENTAPGAGTSTIAYTNGWVNTTSQVVSLSGAITDATSGMYSQQLQRDEVALTGTTCPAFPGTFGTNIGAPVMGSGTLGNLPDNDLVSGMCYQYRVRGVDNVGNVYNRTSGSITRVDDEDPTGTINNLPPFISATQIVGGTTGDGVSGFSTAPAKVALRYVKITGTPAAGPLVTLNTTAANPTWTYNWNTMAGAGLTYPDRTYELYIDVTDWAGNVTTSAAMEPVVVENAPPTIAFDSFANGANPDNSHPDLTASPPRMWFRSAGASGSFTARFTAAAASGIDYVTFPVGPASWTTPAAPVNDTSVDYEQSYGWVAGGAVEGLRCSVLAICGPDIPCAIPSRISRSRGVRIGRSSFARIWI